MNRKMIIGLVLGVVVLGGCGFCLLSGGLLALVGSSDVEPARADAPAVDSAEVIIDEVIIDEELPEVVEEVGDQSARDRAIVTADSFMVALRAGDFALDYEMSSADLQAELQSPDALESIIDGKSLRPESWEWENTTLDLENRLMIMDGKVAFSDGRTGIVNLELELDGGDWDGEWKVYYLNLEPSS